tara:strand:- start:185 stop:1612 length:1428 start_codon:yes stop_codon:yes gene_type:complete
MLEKIRKFSKTIFAKILLAIVVIPFVFWGMGGVFNSGNTNSIAKVNNTNISTQEFIEFLNNSKIDQNVISANINNNILEELLRQFISIKILELEIKDFDIQVTDKDLAQKIKNDKIFFDEKNNFSRVKYEKFLLTNNLTAASYEQGLKDRLLQQKLFSYIGAGIKSPIFLTNKKYIQDTKEINVEFINLNKIYKSQNSYTQLDIEKYINENSTNLEKDFIDFSYSKITPLNLIGIDEYNNDFFNKIDEIENKISNNISFNEIANIYKLKIISKKNYSGDDSADIIEKKIYNLRSKSSSSLTDENDFFLLFNIDKVSKKLPNLNDSNFIKKIKKKLFDQDRYDYNKRLITEINNKTFNDLKFKKIVGNDLTKIQNVTLKSINDDKMFDLDSVNIIYSNPINSFTLVSDDKNNVFIVKIKGEKISEISQNNEILSIYNEKSASDIKRDILLTYDQVLNSKYEIKINEKTLDRVKNYF